MTSTRKRQGTCWDIIVDWGIWSIIKDKGVYFQEKMLEKQREIKPLRRKISLSFCVVGSKDSSTFPSKRNENTLLEPQ